MHIILYELYYLRYVSVENSDTLRYINNFNLSVDDLPSNIKTIFFGDDFNQPVDNLPNSVVQIHFGKSFNQSLNKLPKSVKNISLPDTYNQNIPGFIIVKYFNVNKNIHTNVDENIDENIDEIKINFSNNYDLFLGDQLKYIQNKPKHYTLYN